MILKMNIGTKLVVSFGLIVAGAIFILALIIGLNVSDLSTKNAEVIAEETAAHYGTIIKAELEVAMDEARALAHIFESLANVEGISLTRRKANMILKYFIENNPNFLGVYVAYEPDAFDGNDKNFVDEWGHDNTGRFIPYWTRGEDGKGVVEALLYYDTPGDGDYYQLPKQRKQETVLDPYTYPIQGKEVQLTSLVVPIMDEDEQFIGIGGIDLTLERIQDLITNIKVGEFENASVEFISDSGKIVASKIESHVGTQIDKTEEYAFIEQYLNEDADFIQRRFSTELNEPVLSAGIWVEIGFSNIHWLAMVSIPEKEIFAGMNNTLFLVVLTGIIILGIMIFITVLLARSISRPITLITEGARRLAIGDIELVDMNWKDIEKINNRVDELGDIGRAFSQLIEYQKEKVSLAENIAEGNLAVEVSISSEQDKLGIALGSMVDSLNNLLQQISDTTNQVSIGSNQISTASQTLSEGASEQAGALEEISASLQEINSQSKLNADNSQMANDLAKEAAGNAQKGDDEMKNLNQAMESINTSSDAIKKVVKVIDDIAFQINLLALNANVEAARAGKYGKGFAVVAEEVRNLAARSAGAVQDTTKMVEQTIDDIQRGNQSVRQTGKSLALIIEGVNKVAQYLEDITTASQGQAAGIDQISKGLSEIDSVTQSNTASAEQSASSSDELASQAGRLQQLVHRFTLKKEKGITLYE